MFYEGLYLYQKTGVNTARTLYMYFVVSHLQWSARTKKLKKEADQTVRSASPIFKPIAY
jgi:hypothetical protein